ncbi:MAG: SDR family oxidoreductase [Bacteroidales bacterium]|nr:SDR family oxidoreductase [Bacteroidales bacterium]
MRISNKTILVTGASSGIGKSFAYLLGSKGANLVLVARSQSKLYEIAQDIENKYGVKALVFQIDLSKPKASKFLYDELENHKIEIDILINNAGYGKWGKFEDFPLSEYESMLQLNINSLMELCYLFIEDFKNKPEAGIINVGSTASFMSMPYSAVYGASKSFVLSFTEALVGELSSTNITVSCLCPGGTVSNFNAVANSNNSVDNSTAELMPSDEVAKIGLNAFLQGKHYVLTGRKSQLSWIKFLPRIKVVNMVASYWRKRLNI